MIKHPNYLKAQVLKDVGQYKEAIEEYKKALGTYPNTGAIHANIALCASLLNHHEEANNWAKKALALEPSNYGIHYTTAVVYFLAKNYNEAETFALSALAINSKIVYCMSLLAAICAEKGLYEKGLEYAEKGLAIDPNDPDCLNCKGGILLNLKNAKEGIETLKLTLQREPNNEMTHQLMGNAYMENKQYAEALHWFKSALKLNPNSEDSKKGMKEAMKYTFKGYKLTKGFNEWYSGILSNKALIYFVGAFLFLGYKADDQGKIAGLVHDYKTWIILLITFMFIAELLKPLSDFFMRYHSYGKHLLNKSESLASVVGFCFIITGLISILMYFIAGPKYYFYLFVFLYIMGGFFTRIIITYQKEDKRIIYISYGIGLFFFGVAGVLMTNQTPGILNVCTIIFLLGWLVFGRVERWVNGASTGSATDASTL